MINIRHQWLVQFINSLMITVAWLINWHDSALKLFCCIGDSSNMFFHGFLLIYHVSIAIPIVGHGSPRDCSNLGHNMLCCISSWVVGGAESNSKLWKTIHYSIFSQHSDDFKCCSNDQLWNYSNMERLCIREIHGIQTTMLKTNFVQ